MMTSFEPESIYLRSPNLHLEEFLYGPTCPQNVVFVASTKAEIAGEDITCPHMARNIPSLSSEHVNPRPARPFSITRPVRGGGVI